jgi:hypothetical protein
MAVGETLEVGTRNLPQFLPMLSDANRDGVFGRFDLIDVLESGKHLTDWPAIWHEGDRNGDSVFDQEDIIAALLEDYL